MSSLTNWLDRLEQVWRAQGMPIVDHLRPGVMEDQLRAAWEPRGLILPQEVVEWFGWHDGADGELWSEVMCAPARKLLTVRQALDYYELAMDYSEDGYADEDNQLHVWLPVVGTKHGGYGAIRCSSVNEPNLSALPVTLACGVAETSELPAVEYRVPVITMVQWWVERFESGQWRWDGQQVIDTVPSAEEPLAQRLSGLV